MYINIKYISKILKLVNSWENENFLLNNNQPQKAMLNLK